MKKATKVLLGLATVWPILYMFLFIALIFLMVLLVPSGSGSRGPDPGPASSLFLAGIFALFGLHLFTILGHMALTVFYIIRVFKTERLDQNLKIMWMLLLFFAGMFAQPVFWYLYIWRGMPHTAPQPPQLGVGPQSSWRKQTAAEPAVAYVPPVQPPDWR